MEFKEEHSMKEDEKGKIRLSAKTKEFRAGARDGLKIRPKLGPWCSSH